MEPIKKCARSVNLPLLTTPIKVIFGRTSDRIGLYSQKKKKVSQFHVSQIIPDSTNFPETLDPNNRDAKNKIYINESLKSENRGRLKQARANANEQKYKYTDYIVKLEVKVKKKE